MVPELILYDSICEDQDTSAAGGLEFMVSAERQSIDSTRFKKFVAKSGGDTLYWYSGSKSQNILTYFKMVSQAVSPDTTAYDVIYLNTQGHDSIQDYYWLTNGQFTKAQSRSILYKNGKLERIYRFDDPTDLSDTTSVMVFYRHQGSLDSMVQYSIQNNAQTVMSKTIHNYQSGRLVSLDIFLNLQASGNLLQVAKQELRYNTAGKVDEVLSFNGFGSNNLSFTKTTKYYQRKPLDLEERNSAKRAMPWSVYPNPVSEYLQISGESDAEKFEIYGNGGELVDIGLIGEDQKVNVQNLLEGFYIINLKSGDTGWHSLKFRRM
ncbi:MAG: T9SS type A sorting domain-containing protein [Owenweeksia sp.]|nr:T9SS type A sorting domain-containing protein [Owenweeksia sp.]